MPYQLRLLLIFCTLCLSDASYADDQNKNFVTNDFLVVDNSIINRPWRPAPFDQMQFTYTGKQVKEKWPQLMRGLRIPYPSPEYVEKRYSANPRLFAELEYQDRDWDMHSRNTIEVWILFFRGDFQEAYRAGHKYGGLARTPAIMAEIIYASYLTDLQHEKSVLLQDAANWIAHYAHLFDYSADDQEFIEDYLMLRLGYTYAMGRLIEDAPVPKILASGVPFRLMDVVDEMLEVEPNHPIGLALHASINANIIRRIGKVAGKVGLQADKRQSQLDFDRSIEQVGDMAVVRYEYANSILYLEKEAGIPKAINNLRIAANSEPTFAMEELDRLYAAKKMRELAAHVEKGKSLRKFQKARVKYMKKTGANMFSVLLPPFNQS